MEGATDVSDTLKEVGIIIGEASSDEFFFSSKPGEMPSRWEYLLTYSKEDVNGTLKQVEVIAQIERIISASQALTKELDFDVIKKIIEAGLELKELLSIDSFGWLVPNFDKKWQNKEFQELILGYIRTIETDEALIGLGAHMMAISRKP